MTISDNTFVNIQFTLKNVPLFISHFYKKQIKKRMFLLLKP